MPVVHLGGARSPVTWGRRERRRAACAGWLREHWHPWGNFGVDHWGNVGVDPEAPTTGATSASTP